MRISSVLGVAWILTFSNGLPAQTAKPDQAKLEFTPPSVAGTNNYLAPIYQLNDVKRALGISPMQYENLTQLTADTDKLFKDRYANIKTLPEAERTDRLDKLNQEYTSDWYKGARKIFNDHQFIRYQQLGYQFGGFNAFFDQDVQKQLNLTPAQLRQVREQRVWSNQQILEINRVGASDPDKGTSLFHDYRKQLGERIHSILTPLQQQVWRQLIGEPHTFQPPFALQR